MTSEHAKVILDLYCADALAEAATTRRVLSAIPAGQEEYTPHEKSMKALDLAWHIASADVWFLDGVLNGAFGHGGGGRPEQIRTGADVANWYDANFPPMVAKVKEMPPEKATQEVDFFGVMKLPAVMYLGLLIKHSVHHRGQLSAYLRPMGGKVPGIYGGSADEPMN